MAFAFKRGGCFYVGFRNEQGEQIRKRTAARTLTEARRLAEELELKHERVRSGLEAPPIPDVTYADAVSRYLASLPVEYRSRNTLEGRFKNRILPHLGDRLIRSITPADVRELLAKNDDVSEQTREHLRVAMQGSFSFFLEAKLAAENPAAAVEKVRIPKRMPKYLQLEEIPKLLAEIPTQWLCPVLVALGTAARKGEILAIKKTNVLLRERVIILEETKSDKERRVPIPDWLVPHLEKQLRAAPSPFLFPNPEGKRWGKSVKLHDIVRRALGRAGIVTGYAVACKGRGPRKGCGFAEERQAKGSKVCPRCRNSLRIYPLAKPIRFKELRSTWATHAAAKTGDIRFVQVVLGHGDPKVTTDRYSFALPAHLQSQANRVEFPGSQLGVGKSEPGRTQPSAEDITS